MPCLIDTHEIFPVAPVCHWFPRLPKTRKHAPTYNQLFNERAFRIGNSLTIEVWYLRSKRLESRSIGGASVSTRRWSLNETPQRTRHEIDACPQYSFV